MTVANEVSASHAADAEAARGLSLKVLVGALLAFLAAWVVATLVWGWNGFIGGADIAVLLTFVVILSATRQ